MVESRGEQGPSKKQKGSFTSGKDFPPGYVNNPARHAEATRVLFHDQ